MEVSETCWGIYRGREIRNLLTAKMLIDDPEFRWAQTEHMKKVVRSMSSDDVRWARLRNAFEPPREATSKPTNEVEACEYCGNTSTQRDSRGGCLGCGHPRR
jgi:hypothetical protein